MQAQIGRIKSVRGIGRCVGRTCETFAHLCIRFDDYIMVAYQCRQSGATLIRPRHLLGIARARYDVSDGVVGTRRTAVKCNTIHLIELESVLFSVQIRRVRVHLKQTFNPW